MTIPVFSQKIGCTGSLLRSPLHCRGIASLFRLCLIAFAAFALLTRASANAGEGQFEPLSITTVTGPHHFSVEVMRTQPELEKGLMYRTFMPADQGMLFVFTVEQSVMMWMKNTYIPLDMLFMDKTGKVVGIVANAKPMSEQILTAAVPTFAVLELNGGEAAKIGLKVGDKVDHPIFSP